MVNKFWSLSYKPYYSAVLGYKKAAADKVPDRKPNLITYIRYFVSRKLFDRINQLTEDVEREMADIEAKKNQNILHRFDKGLPGFFAKFFDRDIFRGQKENKKGFRKSSKPLSFLAEREGFEPSLGLLLLTV